MRRPLPAFARRLGRASACLVALFLFAWAPTAVAAIEFKFIGLPVSGIGSGSAVNALEFNAPVGIAAGDLMLVQMSVRGGTGIASITPPPGWGVAAAREDNGTTLAQVVFYRVRDNADVTPYTFGISSFARAMGGMVVYRGVDPVSPIHAFSSRANPASSSITAPALTTTVAGAMIVGFYSTADAGAAITPPSLPLPGMTGRYNAQTAAGPNGVAVRISDSTQVAAGDTEDRIARSPGVSALNIGQLVALVPASIGATAPGGFNAFELITPANAISGRIFTKLAGAPFTLDIVALNDTRSAVLTTFAGDVRVELLNAANNSGALDANKCNPNWTAIPGLSSNVTFGAGDNGRKAVGFTVNDALRNVRVRISFPATGTPTAVGCSTDNFAIRPPAFTSVISNMTNAGTSGIPKARAGADNFTLEARTGLARYDGTPLINQAAVQAHAGAARTGVLGGAFPVAVSGTANGVNAFTYSEVGKFRLLGSAPAAGDNAPRGVYDESFTAVDQLEGDCTGDFSNSLAGGRYGCKFGIVADTDEFGRFHPAAFALTAPVFANRNDIAACHVATTGSIAASSGALTVASAAGFAPGDGIVVRGAGANGTDLVATVTVVAGNSISLATAASVGVTGATVYRQGFSYQDEPMALGFAVMAMSGGPAPDLTQNYSGPWAGGTVVLQAENGNNGVDLGARLTTGATPVWAAGIYTLNTGNARFQRGAGPDGPFDNLQIGVAVSDPDNVVLSGRNMNPATTGNCLTAANCTGVGVANTRIRFGRLKLSNAHGSELLNLPVPAETQYWNGAVFVTNQADSCTTLAASNVTLTKSPASCTTALLGNVAFAGGRSSLVLSRPNAVCRADIVVRLEAGAEEKAYLQGRWTGLTHDQNPGARATFGIYKGGPTIFLREMY